MQGNPPMPVNDPEPEAAEIHRPYPFMEWSMLVGAVVDVRREGVFVRTGLVEDTTPSGDTASIRFRCATTPPGDGFRRHFSLSVEELPVAGGTIC